MPKWLHAVINVLPFAIVAVAFYNLVTFYPLYPALVTLTSSLAVGRYFQSVEEPDDKWLIVSFWMWTILTIFLVLTISVPR